METDFLYTTRSDLKQFALDSGFTESQMRWPNRAFKTEGLDQYLAFADLAADPEQLMINGRGAIYRWILQISHFVRDGTRDYKQNALVDAVRTAFPVGYEFAGNDHRYKVMQPASKAPPVPIDGWSFLPVSITVQTLA